MTSIVILSEAKNLGVAFTAAPMTAQMLRFAQHDKRDSSIQTVAND